MAHSTDRRRVFPPSDLKPSIDPSMVSKSSHKPKGFHPSPAFKDSHLQAKALTASVDSSKFYVVKSKPQLKKNPSGFEKSKKSGRVLDGKKEADEGVESKSVYPVVKHKELKELLERHRFESLRSVVSLSLRGGRRRSFGGSEVELADILANNGVKMVSVDMPPFMQIHAVDCARKVHDSMEKFTSKTLALSLKREFDGAYGPAWHCIVGTSFGSFVTHSVGGFLYFSMDQKLYILLFKTTVQRAD